MGLSDSKVLLILLGLAIYTPSTITEQKVKLIFLSPLRKAEDDEVNPCFKLIKDEPWYKEDIHDQTGCWWTLLLKTSTQDPFFNQGQCLLRGKEKRAGVLICNFIQG